MKRSLPLARVRQATANLGLRLREYPGVIVAERKKSGPAIYFPNEDPVAWVYLPGFVGLDMEGALPLRTTFPHVSYQIDLFLEPEVILANLGRFARALARGTKVTEVEKAPIAPTAPPAPEPSPPRVETRKPPVAASSPPPPQPAAHSAPQVSRAPTPAPRAPAPPRRPAVVERFQLPGRSALSAFFEEKVVDYIRNEPRYREIGVSFPGGVLLHGPPGTGKTYAVHRLAEHLEWEVVEIDAQSVGSKYIHETSKRIGRRFREAARMAPAIVLIDEIDAFVSDRDESYWPARSEEVAEFLRRIPEARENRVLVVATTNRLHGLDKAVTRRGRFDYVLEVGMPTAEEAAAALADALGAEPVEASLWVDDIGPLLAGRPLSDVGFVAEEAKRIAVRAGKDEVDAEDLEQAAKALPPVEGTAKAVKIGFRAEES